MTSYLETWNGGADGVAITNANCIFTNAGTTGLVFDVDAPFFITTTAQAAADAVSRFGRRDGINTDDLSVSIYIKFGSVAPSITLTFLSLRTSASSQIFNLGLTSAGRIIGLVGASLTTITGTNIAAHAVTANKWYRIDAYGVIGDGTGRFTYRICDVDVADTNTPITPAFDSGTTLSAGAVNIDRMYLGGIAATDRVGIWQLGTFRADDALTTLYDGLYTAAPITETLFDNRALIEATGGTPPFTIAQTGGTTTAPEVLDNGAVSNTGRWLVAKHAADALVYVVTDDAAVDSDPVTVPKISATSNAVMRPNGTLTGWE